MMVNGRLSKLILMVKNTRLKKSTLVYALIMMMTAQTVEILQLLNSRLLLMALLLMTSIREMKLDPHLHLLAGATLVLLDQMGVLQIRSLG